jgi:hypothetical protein
LERTMQVDAHPQTKGNEMKVTIGHRHAKTAIVIEDVEEVTRHRSYVYFRVGMCSWTYPWRVIYSFKVEGIIE